MQCVGAGFDHHVDGAAAVAPCFRVGVALHRELIDRVDRQKRPGDTGNAALIDRGGVVPEIVVVRAVDLPVVLRDTGAVDGTGAVDARREFDKLREIPAVERHILDGFVRNHFVQRGGAVSMVTAVAATSTV